MNIVNPKNKIEAALTTLNNKFQLVYSTLLIVLIGSTISAGLKFSGTIDQAKDLAKNDRLEEALRIYNYLLDADKENTALLIDRGNVFLKMYDTEKAMYDFLEVIRLDSSKCDGYLGMAKYHSQKFHFGMSTTYLELAFKNINVQDDKYNYLYTKGEIEALFGRNEEAEKTLFEAISIRSDEFQLLDLFTRTMKAQGKEDEAIEYLYIVSNENEMSAYTLAKMGYLMNSMDQLSEANLYLEQALNMEPKNSEALCNMAFTYMKLGKYQDALKKIDKSIQIDPLHAFSYRVRAEVSGRLGKASKACKDIQRAISLDHFEDLSDEISKLSTSYCGY